MGFALTPGEAPLHFSRSKNVMHVGSPTLVYLFVNIVHHIVTGYAPERTRRPNTGESQ